MARKTWSTLFKGGSPIQDPDPITNSQPDNTVDVDDVIPSHTETLREKLHALAKLVGDSANNPSGSILSVLNALGVSRLRETGGPTALPLGAITDGQFLKRSGASIVGAIVNQLRETGGPTTLTIGDIVDGEFLKRVGSQIVSDVAGGGGITPSILLNENLAGLGAQDLKSGGDGVKVINGTNYFIANQSVCPTFGLDGATGLVISHNTTFTATVNTTRSGPIFGILLSELGLTFNDLAFIRASMILDSKSIVSNNDRMWIGIENRQTGSGVLGATSWQGGQQHTAGAVRWVPILNLNGVAGGGATDATGVADDVWQILLMPDGDAIILSGVSVGGDFPAQSTMRARELIRFDGNVANVGMLMSDLAVYFGMDTQNTSGTVGATISRFKVEAK